MLANPFWHALGTEHSHLALGEGAARRYPVEVLPFGALERPDRVSLLALRELMTTGESIFVTGDGLPEVRGLQRAQELPGWQMVHAGEVGGADEGVAIKSLGPDDAERMVALKKVAFPGYFGIRTVELGEYFGICVGGDLVAMAGERLALPGAREVSAVCTHPAHTGKGFAAALTRQVLRSHAERGLRSFLHVVASNARAIALYERLGFRRSRPMRFVELQRVEAS